MQGFSWVLIVVTVIVALLAVLTALYLLVYYQHPEDKNQVLILHCNFALPRHRAAGTHCSRKIAGGLNINQV